MSSDKHILLTIDVEDWFQVENFKPWIPFSTWDERELRVEKNTHNLLNLFDSIKTAGKLEARGQKDNRLVINEARMPGGSEDSEPSNLQASQLQASGNKPPSLPASKPPSFFASQPQATDYELSATSYEKSYPKVTFFILGWIAEKLPHLVREIHARGHEVASHGCNHELPDQLSADELKQDLTDSKKLLEDLIGAEVVGYRAPSFAVTDGVLKTIEDSGYLYDSSYNSFGMHGRYGKISLNGAGRNGIARKTSENFFELPISNLKFVGQTLPWGGGGYFRLMPVKVFNWGIKSILTKNDAYVFYAHPWEIDPNQLRVNDASLGYKFRHYTNLYKTETRLRNLIESFRHCRFVTCSQYLEETI